MNTFLFDLRRGALACMAALRQQAVPTAFFGEEDEEGAERTEDTLALRCNEDDELSALRCDEEEELPPKLIELSGLLGKQPADAIDVHMRRREMVGLEAAPPRLTPVERACYRASRACTRSRSARRSSFR